MQPCWISALISLKLCVFITDPKLFLFFYGSVCHNIEVGKCHAILIYSDRDKFKGCSRFFYSRRPKTHTHTHIESLTDTSDIASDPVYSSLYYCRPFTDSQTAACPHTHSLSSSKHTRCITLLFWPLNGGGSLSLPVLTLIFPALLPCPSWETLSALLSKLNIDILWINWSLMQLNTIETWVSGNLMPWRNVRSRL